MDEDEEGTIANIAKLMASCGLGLCEEELLDSINLVLLENSDKRQFVLATMKTVDGLMKRHQDLKTRLSSASSLDPARANQACEETRNSMFTKLDNYVLLLHELSICEEKAYCEFKSNCIYNMYECALDTTKKSKKIVCSQHGIKRLFIITPEGDGKMKLHISLALTTRADGESSLRCIFF